MQQERASPASAQAARARWQRRARRGLMALGPGLLGLVADNDAGGLLSYLVTGASHRLALLYPALVLLAPLTYFVQRLAMDVALATRRPYSQAVAQCLGPWVARLDALVLYALNAVILVTEFVGMTLALRLWYVPPGLAQALELACVLLLTSSSIYPQVEQLLLRVAILNLAFLPALLTLHPAPGAWRRAFAWGTATPHNLFLVLALAGNAVSPWMIYWQHDAVWAGPGRGPRQRKLDLAAGVGAQVAVAALVMLLGGLVPSDPHSLASPLAWLRQRAGPLPAGLFALGLLDSGLLAACTISLSSLWTLKGAFRPRTGAARQSPASGRWRLVHALTLAAAAAVTLLPRLAAGTVALWAQALGALWLPVSLAVLGTVAWHTFPRRQGRGIPGRTLGAWVLAAGLALLACISL
jgi:Mn2+/Fe2+ NRAMP family transporter